MSIESDIKRVRECKIGSRFGRNPEIHVLEPMRAVIANLLDRVERLESIIKEPTPEVPDWIGMAAANHDPASTSEDEEKQ